MSVTLPPTAAGAGPVLAAARNLLNTVANTEMKGMLDARKEAYELPMTLETIAEAIRLRASQHTSKDPLDPQYVAAVNQLAATVTAAANAARALGAAFDALHATELARLLRPRNGEYKWDTVANQ